eukprot:4236564-Amphidinium_carterae.1
MNPATWHEFPRDFREMFQTAWNQNIFATPACCFTCIISQLMQAHVAYEVLLISLTIVVKTDSLADVVFNGLALIFLTDLDDYWYLFISSAVRFDGECYESVGKSMEIRWPMRERGSGALR